MWEAGPGTWCLHQPRDDSARRHSVAHGGRLLRGTFSSHRIRVQLGNNDADIVFLGCVKVSVPDSFPFRYHVFGLAIESERPIVGLEPSAGRETPDVRVHDGRGPAAPWPEGVWSSPSSYVSPFRDEHGRPRGQAWDLEAGHLRFLTNEDAEFVLDRQGTQLWVHAPASSPSEIGEYLIGPIFGLLLRRRGQVCLHASVVCLNGRAWALLGAEGSGKSTLAAVFAMLGHAVIADDLAALVECDGALLVPPGPAYVRARHGAVERAARVLGQENVLSSSYDPEFVDLDLALVDRPERYGRAVRRPMPLGAIYLLDCGDVSPLDAVIEPMPGPDAVMTLLAHSWATRPLGRDSRRPELDMLTRAASQLPVRRVRVRAHADDAVALARRIAEDSARLTATPIGPVGLRFSDAPLR